MKLKDAISRIEEKGVPAIILLDGEEPYFIKEVVGAIRRALSGKNLVWRDYAKPTKDEPYFRDLRQVDLRFPTRVFFVRSADSLRWAGVQRFIDHPVKNSHLIFQVSKIPKEMTRRGLLVNCKKLNERKGEVEEWLIGLAKGQDLALSEVVARFLVSVYGADLMMLANEVKKFVILFEGRDVTVGDVEPYLMGTVGLSFTKMYAAIVRKDKKALIRTIMESQKDGTTQGLVGMLFSFVERFLTARAVRGVDVRDAAQTLGKSPYLVKMDMKHAGKFRGMGLWKAVRCLAEADQELKSGRASGASLLRAVEALCV